MKDRCVLKSKNAECVGVIWQLSATEVKIK